MSRASLYTYVFVGSWGSAPEERCERLVLFLTDPLYLHTGRCAKADILCVNATLGPRTLVPSTRGWHVIHERCVTISYV